MLLRDPAGVCETRALLCTDQQATPEQSVSWFVQRWQMEVTREVARAPLGVETQRQWLDLAIARTTPALFGLFALVTLLAQHLLGSAPCLTRTAAWSTPLLPAFSDALALARHHLWSHTTLPLSLSTRAEQ